jgi:predicted RNase H-like HicB family nuclease
MIDLPYSLVVEATNEPEFFGFYSPDLEGFSGVGHSIEDCIYRARWGMKEHVEMLSQRKLAIPPVNSNPVVTIQNEQSAVA